MHPPVACSLSGRCSGCAWIERPYADQLEDKREHLASTLAAAGMELPKVRLVSIAPAGLRDRVDLTIDARDGSGGRKIGLYEIDANGLVDIAECPALSAPLEAWLKDFRAVPLEVARGSVRLRVAPDGARGAWLDFANVDVKRLLEERTALDALLALGAAVEIGQRRKALVERDGQLKLGEPALRPWFETYLGPEEKPTALYGPIGGFTQPGFAAARALVREALAAFALAGAREVVEFGSGNGCFTLPLAATGARVVACETDELACAGLARSLAESGLEAQVEIRRGDFQSGGRAKPSFEGAECVFVDPPRSGLKRFLDPLEALSAERRPRHFIYVSCFAESMAGDLARLQGLGYGLDDLTLIDQFPQSPHYEAVARLSIA